jgi:hypothetical protein
MTLIKSSNWVEPKGLGDTIANITHATGLDKLVADRKTGQPCAACQQRQTTLNRWFPYR